MVTNTETKKRKRPSKGQRKHNRLVKQEGRKANLSEAEMKKLLLRK
jgi:hypothetical protein